MMSLSSRRAWIEIHWGILQQACIRSRSPHGERGLKSRWTGTDAVITASLSSRRAWIEIAIVRNIKACLYQSLSSRRAWIEIIICTHSLYASSVALLTESVDWNWNILSNIIYLMLSLSSRRAWIEITPKCVQEETKVVALLTESVDWNSNSSKTYEILSRSLSSRRAWIEIWLLLKSNNIIKSLSSRRAWIEIKIPFLNIFSGLSSLSSRRAWIEINANLLTLLFSARRSPHGERGLKYFHRWQLKQWEFVALLTESVDWNMTTKVLQNG